MAALHSCLGGALYSIKGRHGCLCKGAPDVLLIVCTSHWPILWPGCDRLPSLRPAVQNGLTGTFQKTRPAPPCASRENASAYSP